MKVNRLYATHIDEVNVDIDDGLEDIILDIGDDAFQRVHVYDTLRNDKEMPLYLGEQILHNCHWC